MKVPASCTRVAPLLPRHASVTPSFLLAHFSDGSCAGGWPIAQGTVESEPFVVSSAGLAQSYAPNIIKLAVPA